MYEQDKIEINDDITFKKLANEKDKKRKSINITVDEVKKEDNLIKLKYIICPKCKEGIKINLKDYKINLYDCKNNHKISNMLLNEFVKSQKIELTKIICNICYKKNIDVNELYKCCSCSNNICCKCKVKHDKTHKMINYNMKNSICNKHDEIYIKYCSQCKIDICKLCEDEHTNHKIINYDEITPNKNNIKNQLNKFKKSIDELNNDIKNIIKKLNNIFENIKLYYNIDDYYINNNKK